MWRPVRMSPAQATDWRTPPARRAQPPGASLRASPWRFGVMSRCRGPHQSRRRMLPATASAPRSAGTSASGVAAISSSATARVLLHQSVADLDQLFGIYSNREVVGRNPSVRKRVARPGRPRRPSGANPRKRAAMPHNRVFHIGDQLPGPVPLTSSGRISARAALEVRAAFLEQRHRLWPTRAGILGVREQDHAALGRLPYSIRRCSALPRDSTFRALTSTVW